MQVWHWIGSAVAALGIVLAFVAAGHALLYKRMPQSAFGWIAVCVMLPLGGALLYYLFGINRVERRARELRGPQRYREQPTRGLSKAPPDMVRLASLAERLSGLPLLGGNRVEVLHNGEQAFPAMLRTIAEARDRVFLSSYLFDSATTGRAFAAALGKAVARGVTVRVLLDGVGELYSFPRAGTMLTEAGVPVERFVPPRLLPPSLHVNLRNHRKILVADGRIAYSGGINIGDRYLAENTANANRVVDVHCRFVGPVAAQVEAVFLDDWRFASGERLDASPTPAESAGTSLCRVIADGPDGELGPLRSMIAGAIALARKRVTIMTPYFLPTRELTGMLQSAALRGVDVTVILPARNNLPFVHRATRHLLWELLNRGIRIHYQPPPFVHSKLMLIDDGYAMVGSANLDPRSLRLNFELNVEIYDRAIVSELSRHCESVIARSSAVALADVDRRPLATRLIDGAAWLFSPYL
jgi:cardiolipin synthase